MKIQVEEKTKKEVDIPLPCFRQTVDRVCMIIAEEKYVVIRKDGESYTTYNGSLFISDWFVEGTSETTKQIFQSALAAHDDRITELTKQL